MRVVPDGKHFHESRQYQESGHYRREAFRRLCIRNRFVCHD
jgi:AcrR family transcriptional regulator